MVSKTWRVYGCEGHRQRISFGESLHYKFQRKGYEVEITVDCEDVTHTNDYVDVTITAPTFFECDVEFVGQLTDGIFENARVGNIIELFSAYKYKC